MEGERGSSPGAGSASSRIIVSSGTAWFAYAVHGPGIIPPMSGFPNAIPARPDILFPFAPDRIPGYGVYRILPQPGSDHAIRARLLYTMKGVSHGYQKRNR